MRQRDVKHQDFNLERGFSLMEVLISMAVFTIVMFAIYTTFASSAGTFSKGDVKADIHQNARASMDLMVREIRLAGFLPEDFPALFDPEAGGSGCAGPPFTAVTTATPTTITICGDVQDGDNDPLTNSSDQVTYTWVDDTNGDGIVDPGENEIQRLITYYDGTTNTLVTSTDTVALNIMAFSLTYVNGGGGPPANLADIRRVVIDMTAEQPQQQSAAIGGRTRSPFATRVPDYRLITDVRLRNLEF